MNVESVQYITAWLQKQMEELKNVSKTIISITSDRKMEKITLRKRQEMIKAAWDRVYAEIVKKKDAKKLDRGDSNHKKIESSYDFIRSYQMLGLADGSEQDMIVKSAQKGVGLFHIKIIA